MDIGRQGQTVGEIEMRLNAWQRAGVLRLTGWQQHANAGDYLKAVQDPNFDGEESIKATRRIRAQYGYIVNLAGLDG